MPYVTSESVLLKSFAFAKNYSMGFSVGTQADFPRIFGSKILSLCSKPSGTVRDDGFNQKVVSRIL